MARKAASTMFRKIGYAEAVREKFLRVYRKNARGHVFEIRISTTETGYAYIDSELDHKASGMTGEEHLAAAQALKEMGVRYV